VVETGKRVPAAARKIESAILSEILSSAREGDSFAMLTTREPRKEFRFDAGREALQAAVDEIESSLPDKNKEAGVLDAVAEGIGWFQKHREGDAILLLTMGTESSHRTTYAKVRESLTSAHVRLFGVQLGGSAGTRYSVDYIVATGPAGQVILSMPPGMGAVDQVTVGMAPVAPIGPTGIGISPDDFENFFTLSRGTGGFGGLVSLQGESWNKYKLTDDRLKAVKYIGEQEYKAMVEYYRIRIQRPAQHFSLELSDPIRKQLPQARVIYGISDRTCAPSSNPPSP
jgi:hypothetical protein